MKILSLVDSFKNSLTSLEISKILKEEATKQNIKLDYLPISDGGDGFLDVISMIINGQMIDLEFINFNGEKQVGSYFLSKEVAYIEVARFIGLGLVREDEKDPFNYGSHALGVVIGDIYQRGIKKIVIGLGGTATNDFGMGLISELGFKFCEDGNKIRNITPSKFKTNTQIIRPQSFVYQDLELVIVSDVKNVLFGSSGATYTFGTQKGVLTSELERLEKIGIDFCDKLIQLGYPDTQNLKGAGAAGGLGFILTSIFNGKMVSGIDFVLDLIKFDLIQNNYDFIITGEGKIDQQSLEGKVVFEVASRTTKPVILICAINDLLWNDIPQNLNNIKKILSIVPRFASKSKSLENPEKYLKLLAKSLFSELKNTEVLK